jgi:pimeloyl-ACP methyl ester carboxylesterase
MSARTNENTAGEVARRRLLDGTAAEEHMIESAGMATSFLAGGDGPPLVLLHGPGEFKERWVRVVDELSRTHRVLAPDFPGHGRSAPIPDDIDPERVFAWLDDLIDTCGDQRPVLVGHILGGSVAARYAVDRSDRLERLVLVDSLGLAKFRPKPRFALGLIAFMARPTERSHRRFMTQCLADAEPVAEVMGDSWTALRDYTLDRAKDPNVKAAMKFFMSTLGVPRIADSDLAAITTPTSLIWGRHDKANRLRVAQAASDRLGWPLHIIDGAADDPPMERPAEFVTAVLQDAPAQRR